MKAALRSLLLLSVAASTVWADDFRDKVVPILETKCVRCHGQTVKKGGLSLASAEGAKRGGDSGFVIEQGKPEESLLVDKITGEKPEMPKGEKPLSVSEVESIKHWIAAGAHWTEGLTLHELKQNSGPWWAIQPLRRTEEPRTKDQKWVRNPIDAFILESLAKNKLSPSPEADRRTLIRRLSFDLLGLPPSPAEIETFLNDESRDAYEKLVDRLLASPRYGERWGRHWLDVVHYGDTHGYDKDKKRPNAWRYRDYVIKALNDDKPYAHFIREQIAGDVMDPLNPESLTATGFLAAGPWDFVGHVELREGTVEKEKTRLIDRDDMLSNAIETFNSVTVHCARCHDHKFDPIRQKDYYRLQAVFAGIDRGDRTIEGPERFKARLALDERAKGLADREKALKKQRSEARTPEMLRLDEMIGQWKSDLASEHRTSKGPSPSNGYHSAIHPTADGAASVQIDLGKSFSVEEIHLVPARPVDFPDTPGFGFPHRFKVEIADELSFANAETVFEEETPDDESRMDEPLTIRPSGKSARVVRVSASRLWKRTEDYVFALAELEVISGGKNVALGATVSAPDSIEGGLWSKRALVDGFSSRAKRPQADDPDELRRIDVLIELENALRKRRGLSITNLSPEIQAEASTIERERAELKSAQATLPPADVFYGPVPHAPRPIHVLKRGDVEQPAESVEAGSLTCVPGLNADFFTAKSEGERRLMLANWIADANNVLTWRSIVNRTWHYHFGKGLVDTPNDFGRNGGTPSHPELLDWLAVEFRDSGGSLKKLHRLIVTSATYRQISAHDATKAAIDGDNRLLWRQNRRRLEAEAIRDAVLATSGQLDLTMGGPGFEPFRFKDDHSPIYDHEDASRINAPECRRRAVYRFSVRSVPNPFVECLDGADPNAMTPVRNTTITALQALTLLNDPFMIQQAEAFAKRAKSISTNLPDQVEMALELAFGRKPSGKENTTMIAFAKKHGLPAMCRLLFNANEFVFVD